MKSILRQLTGEKVAFTAFALLALASTFNKAWGACYCQMENISVSFSKDKCGYHLDCDTSVPKKFFLVRSVIILDQYHDVVTYPEFEAEEDVGITTQTTISTRNRQTCAETVSYSGSADRSSCCPDIDESASITNTTVREWSDGDNVDQDVGEWVGGVIDYDRAYTPANTHLTETASCDSTTDAYDGVAIGTFTGASTYEHAQSTTTLADEYTTTQVRADAVAGLPALTGSWGFGTGTAFYSLNSDESTATVGRMKYRVKVPNSIKDETYTVKWKEVTVYPDGKKKSEDKQDSVPGTGDPVTPAYGPEHVVDVPGTQSSIYETAPAIFNGDGQPVGN